MKLVVFEVPMLAISVLAFIGSMRAGTWRRAAVAALGAWGFWVAWTAFKAAAAVATSPARGNVAQLLGYVSAELVMGAGAAVVAAIAGYGLRRLASALAGRPDAPPRGGETGP